MTKFLSNYKAEKNTRKKGATGGRDHASRQVRVLSPVALVPLQEVALDQRLDPLLDHVRVHGRRRLAT